MRYILCEEVTESECGINEKNLVSIPDLAELRLFKKASQPLEKTGKMASRSNRICFLIYLSQHECQETLHFVGCSFGDR
jgi:hypothetical protein